MLKEERQEKIRVLNKKIALMHKSKFDMDTNIKNHKLYEVSILNITIRTVLLV